MSLDLKLSKVDRIYRPGDMVSGVVVVNTKGSMSHSGISLVMQGEVTLQLSAKSVGYFEAFYNSLKPIQLLNYSIEVAKAGKIPEGGIEIPFEFKLEPIAGQTLYETYHGVFVNIQYWIQCDMLRPLLAKNLQKKLEFIVETEKGKMSKEETVPFSLAPDSLDASRKGPDQKLPQFKISGHLTAATCNISNPFTGELVVDACDEAIKSIELQLVRVETCGCADGFAKEATEIQNIQIGDGDVCRGLSIPIYMIFPRLFTCPTIATRTFKIEFEVNLVLMLEDNSLISKNFPIRLVRAG
eukprot:TRINITY_DN6394_c1_g1_i2.p1 TRINITY_DN6394_c1_g1~~TRINITY_DN6394_c1_g1_i2.p1  ORF type:complete len:298 (-),score=58.20 TRINITY_DN6394_c1_g1_i2:79-972(-)